MRSRTQIAEPLQPKVLDLRDSTLDSLTKYAEVSGLLRHAAEPDYLDRLLCEVLEEALAEHRYRERRKTRAVRRRHEMTKYWVRNDLASSLEALRKALEAEGDRRAALTATRWLRRRRRGALPLRGLRRPGRPRLWSRRQAERLHLAAPSRADTESAARALGVHARVGAERAETQRE